MSRQVSRMNDRMQENRLAQFTSLVDALAKLDRIEPIVPAEQDLRVARGHTLAVDARTDVTLRLAGARLRAVDIALLSSGKVDHISIRLPHVLVMHSSPADAIDPAAGVIASAIDAEGGCAVMVQLTETGTLEAACDNAPVAGIHGIIVTGVGEMRDEAAVRTLARIGRVEFDGVGLAPGGSTAFGLADALPVLLLPGEIHCALAAWLALGRRMIARLAFRLIEEQPFLLELARPIASTPGIARVVPVRRRAAQVEPLADWTPRSIGRADGWILVPADSEGYAAGARVAMRPWP
jgi:molybdopterin molybdotransferase